ncbi:MAG TPA: hypothetical protein VFR46_10130, partial [Actinomycetes bacterium]|nr:hypothetical protein [Actinomycetes bacterium]
TAPGGMRSSGDGDPGDQSVPGSDPPPETPPHPTASGGIAVEDTEAAFEASDDDTTLDALRAPDAGSEGAPEFREPAMPEEEGSRERPDGG